jgi:hypothetical protein
MLWKAILVLLTLSACTKDPPQRHHWFPEQYATTMSRAWAAAVLPSVAGGPV